MDKRQVAPVALSIAGSDNSAGAGIQADLKTFTALGVYGLTAVTCVVAEVPGKVSAIQALEPSIVAKQIRLCFEAYPVGAVKTGMLHSRETIEAVAEVLKSLPPVGLVIDPVMIATSGTPLLKPDGIEAYKTLLFPRATLVTPNLDEVAVLIGRKVTNLEEMRLAGLELASRFGAHFLIKGGHLQGGAVDLLVSPAGDVAQFSAPRVPRVATHGTGCTFSASIAAGLARGLALPEAVQDGKSFVSRAIGSYLRWPKQSGGETHALNHAGLQAIW